MQTVSKAKSSHLKSLNDLQIIQSLHTVSQSNEKQLQKKNFELDFNLSESKKMTDRLKLEMSHLISEQGKEMAQIRHKMGGEIKKARGQLEKMGRQNKDLGKKWKEEGGEMKLKLDSNEKNFLNLLRRKTLLIDNLRGDLDESQRRLQVANKGLKNQNGRYEVLYREKKGKPFPDEYIN